MTVSFTPAGGAVSHEPPGRRDTLHAAVIRRTERPERQIHLGREDEHREPAAQIERAPHESNRDRHSEQRHPEAREQLECEGGDEGDAQRRHRAGAEALGDVTDALHLRGSTAEDAQRRQALQDVEEMGAEARERLPPPSRALLRVVSDQRHEQRDGRQRQHEDDRRQPVDAEHVCNRDDRNRERRDELREIATEVVVEQIHTAGQQRGRLPRRNIRPRATRCECAAHSPTAHVIDGGGRRDMTARLGQPDEERAKRERGCRRRQPGQPHVPGRHRARRRR